MAKSSRHDRKQVLSSDGLHRHGPLGGAARAVALMAALTAALTAALSLAGCAVQFENQQAAQELAQRAKPPGSVYTGWRVFQDKCAGCHGAAGNGTASAPDLMPQVREMGARRFAGLVLQRYDWTRPAAQAASDGPAREAAINDILLRKDTALAMPEWLGEPQVNAHVIDLYAYLSARAAGTQGPHRPAQ